MAHKLKFGSQKSSGLSIMPSMHFSGPSLAALCGFSGLLDRNAATGSNLFEWPGIVYKNKKGCDRGGDLVQVKIKSGYDSWDNSTILDEENN